MSPSAGFKRKRNCNRPIRIPIEYHSPLASIEEELVSRMRASLFITCYNDTLYPETGRAVVRLLERLGVELDFHPKQTCCGQMHANTGFRGEAFSQAKRFIRLYKDTETVVIPSSSCVAMMRDQYPGLIAELGNQALQKEFETLLPRVYELSEFLIDRLGVEDVGAYSLIASPTTPVATACAHCALATGLSVCSPKYVASTRSRSRTWTVAAASAAPSRSKTLKFPPPCWPSSFRTSSPPAPNIAPPSTTVASCTWAEPCTANTLA